jgi:hypothetical protein
LLLKPGAGGILPGSTSCGAELQVPTHICDDFEFAYPDILQKLIIKNRKEITENECRKDLNLLKKKL